MKQNLKYRVAVAGSKLAKKAMRLLGRDGTHTPGQIALKIDPNLLKHLPKSKVRVAITGTNGKTSVSNLVSGFLASKNLAYLNNSFGSNILQGTTTALIDGLNFKGDKIKDYAVLEVDELASRQIFPDYKPQYLAITNLFRDSYRRNANVEFIFSRLNRFIEDDTHLILNADDLISSQLKPQNPRTYFSIASLGEEKTSRHDLINDLTICPVCDHPLTYEFQHYHHIGKAACSNCGFSNPKPDYQITQAFDDHFILRHENEDYTVNYSSENVVNLYNVLVVIVTLHVMGFDLNEIIAYVSNPQFPQTRFEEIIVNDKKIITIMGKDQNPVAVTRAFDYIQKYDTSKSLGIILTNPTDEHGKEHENVAYLYDVNFEYLNHPHIKRVGIGTARYLDYQARLELAGYPKDQIISRADELDFLTDFPIDDLDVLFLIPGTKNLKKVNTIKEGLISKAKE